MADTPTVTAHQTVELQKDGGYVYLDVRTPEEFEAGHAPAAVNVPVLIRTAAGERRVMRRNQTPHVMP